MTFLKLRQKEMTVSRFVGVDVTSAKFKADPFPFYEYLRAEEPVRRVRLPNKQEGWLVARYDDVSALLKDERFAKDPKNALTPEQMKRQQKVPGMFAPLMRNMLDRDDPDHARLKKLVQKAFTRHRVEALRASTQARSDELIDRMLAGGGAVDLMRGFAEPLPVQVISDLLGVLRADQAKFARWSRTLVQNVLTPLSVLMSLPQLMAFLRYLRRLIEQKRAEPEDDLVSALVEAEEAGEHLDADELLAMIAILLTAGHETTTNLIGNGVLALLENPEQMARLRSAPEMGESAVEELLRYGSPVAMSTNRFAREDVEIAGTRIARGSVVLGVIASANRDERAFANADALDLERRPNRHLSFGQGGHYCVGAALSRMEGDIAVNTLLRRLPGLRLADGGTALKWRGGLLVRGLESLRVEIGAR